MKLGLKGRKRDFDASPQPPLPDFCAMAVDILNLVLITVSCVVCCLLILLMVVVLYKMNPSCCRFRAAASGHNTGLRAPHYNRRRTRRCSRSALAAGAARSQLAAEAQLPGRPFVIGKPSDYQLDGGLPRLPSYESVRRKDRQRHFHQMIAQRFGLLGSQEEVPSQPPPTYDETLRQTSQLAESDPPLHSSRDQSSERRDDTHNHG